MTRHAAWLIDLDGTLYRPWPVKLAMGVQLFWANGQVRRVIRAFRHEHELLRTTDCDNPFAEQLARASSKLGLPIEQVRSIIDDWMFARPGRWLRRFRRDELLAEIEQFRTKGGRTALVSDYPARAKLAALEATHLFDVVITNGETTQPYRMKPAPDPFLLAARTLNVPAADCLVLGDRLDADGLAAERAGMSFRLVR